MMFSDLLVTIVAADAAVFASALTYSAGNAAYRDRHVYRWRVLRYASNRAFALARALNKAKNEAQLDASDK